MPAILDKILRIGEGKILRQLEAIAQAVNAIEDDFVAMSDDELQGMTAEFKQRLANGESLDDLMPEAFATVREAAKRVTGMRPFDVQVMGGAALHLGNIAEMKTGEGKTLVATLPSYLNALSGKGVHVVTVNDYLAKYQSEMMGRIHHFLGLEVGVILPEMRPDERRVAYNCDITYGTNNELGFDYLRDNMAGSIEECVQRGHNFAVVDEVDSILIDEARTPLIISGPTQDEVRWYAEFAKIARTLVKDVDYEVDEKKRTISVLEPGITKVEDHLGIENLYESANTPLISFLNNSIKAKELFRNDKEYVVMDGEVLIVDEHTGRMLAGRRYNDGLHQAIEAKEGVTVREEYQTLATVTLQNYFRLYEKLSGMTGTAMTEASEFDKIYKLGVVPIPTNKPMQRIDQADLVYRTEEAKYDAVVEDIAERHEKGQPVLVGTVSVEKSEHLSNKLRKRGIPHTVLNAKVHADEAKIVAMAGHKGAVTVATNMAGRGTDIMLGGSVEFLADAELRKQGPRPGRERRGVRSRVARRARADRGAGRRRARRGPGPRRPLRRRHRAPRVAPHRQPAARSFRPSGRPGRVPVLPVAAGRADAAVQVRLGRPRAPGPQDPGRRPDREQAGHQRDRQRPGPGRVAELRVPQERPQVRRRDGPPAQGDLRRAPRGPRGRGPGGADPHLHRRRRHRLRRTGRPRGSPRSGTSTRCGPRCARSTRSRSTPRCSRRRPAGVPTSSPTSSSRPSRRTPTRPTTAARREVGEEVMRELERRVVLSVLDRKWREHLYEMDYLREGIYLRAYSQRDPLVEYQREGFDMFAAMMDGIKEESVGFLFNLEVQVEAEEEVEEAEEVVEPMRQPVPGAPGREVPQIRAKGLDRPSSRTASPTPRRARTARPRSRPRPPRTTRSPGSAATPSAPAARARSTRSATVPRAGRRG